jgi:hypothetical protein
MIARARLTDELCTELHHRMAVVLGPETWPEWLGEEPANAPTAQSPSCALSDRGNDVLAGERAGWQRPGQ